MISGILLVDKPAGPTSHDAVAVVRRAAGQKRVGHAGTLDPAATGLLVMLLGSATRLADAFVGMPKTYEAVVELGSTTDTGDAQGVVTETAPVPALDRAAVEGAVAALMGERAHVPPPFSAVKVGGATLYKIARAGGDVPEAPARTVRVHTAEVTAFEPPRISLVLSVSKGTYVRVLAGELGRALGVPAHLAALRRTSSGPLAVGDAQPLDAIAASGLALVERSLIDPRRRELGVARARVSDAAMQDVRVGRPLDDDALEWLDGPADSVLVLGDEGVAAWYERAGQEYRPRAVLAAVRSGEGV